MQSVLILYLQTKEDFYEFSCGGFLKSKRIPDEQPRIDVFDDLRDTLAYNVAGQHFVFFFEIMGSTILLFF